MIETAAVLKLVDEFTAPSRKILEGNEKLDRGLRDTQKHLNDLKASQGDIQSFTKLEAQSTSTRIALDKQQKVVAKLAKEFKNAERPTKKLTREFEQAKRRAGELKQAHGAETIQLEVLRRRMDSAGISTNKLSRYEQKLGRDIDKATRDIREQDRALKNHNSTMRKTQQLADKSKAFAQKSAVAGATGIAGLWVTKRGLDGLGEYKASLADVAVTAGLTNDQVNILQDTISQTQDVSFAVRADIADGAKVLVAAGLDFDFTNDSIPAISKTAVAAEAEITDVAKTAFALLDNLDLPVNKLTQALDMLTEAGKQGRFELADMSQYFPSLTAQAKRLGLEGTEGVATLGAALQIALKGAGDPSEAANNMKNFLAKVTSPETIKRAADLYGVSLEQELKAATARGLNPLEFMVQRVHQLTGGDAFRVGELFGDLQVQQFLTPMLAELEEYKRIKNEVLSADGTVDADLQRRVELDPTIGWKQLGDDVKELRDEALTPLLPVLRDLANDIKPIVSGLGDWMKEHPTLTKFVVGSTVALFGLMAVIAPLLSIIASGVTIWAMWGLRMAAVGGSAGFLTKALSMLKGVLLFIPRLALRMVGGLVRLGALLKGVGTAALWLGRTVLPLVGRAILMIGRALLLNPIGLIITGIAGAAYLIIKNWTPIAGFFTELWSGIKNSAVAAFNFFKNLIPFGTLIDGALFFKDIVSGVWSTLKSGLMGVYDWIINSSPFGLLISGVSKLKSLIGDFFGGDESSVSVQATKVLKTLPEESRQPQYARIGRVARARQASNDDSIESKPLSANIQPLRPASNSATVVEKNEFNSSFMIQTHEGMDEEKVAELIDKKQRAFVAENSRRRRGRLSGS